MKCHHLLKVQLSIIPDRIGSLYQQEMGLLSHSIDNHQNRFMLFVSLGILWKSHINYLPLPFRKLYSLSHTSRPVVFYFHLLAVWALVNKLNNVFVHTFQAVYLSQIKVHIFGTRMNGIPGSISLLYNPLLDSIHPRYTQCTLILQNTTSPLFKI